MDGDTLRLVIFISVFLIMLILELFIPRHPIVDSKPRRLGINLGLTGLNTLLVRLVFGAAAVDAAKIAGSRGWGLLNVLDWPSEMELFIGVVFLDFAIYVQHVIVHKVPFFWLFHVVHHSDLDLDVSSGLRFHPIEILGSMLYKIAIVYLLGPSPLTVLVFEVILNVMALFSHSNITLPGKIDHLCRKIIVTPDMHRIHHSVEVRETNSNYGFNLSVWDRLLGTYTQEALKEQPEIVIGLDTIRHPDEVTFKNLLLMPLRNRAQEYSQPSHLN
ncbi:MAG: sterol desaturase family protein [Nitrospinaceae bacterium]|nr:sterol desaturase family protein [Nitrospinaceae bacterium]